MMQLLELLLTKHAIAMGDHDKAVYVATHAHRHVLQLIDQMFDKEIVRSHGFFKQSTDHDYNRVFIPHRRWSLAACHRALENEINWQTTPIADRCSTFGFTRWRGLCEANGVRPVYGVELPVAPEVGKKKVPMDLLDFFSY